MGASGIFLQRENQFPKEGQIIFKGRKPETILTNILPRSVVDYRGHFGLDI
jgi:hypothetical protein